MKQLCIISGKGGTGKTSITAAFSSLAENAVLADCDVDASDLHLLLKPRIKKTTAFSGLQIAQIDSALCTHCQACVEHCHFDAISSAITLLPSSCEGCGLCAYVCPVDAITMVDRDSGFAYLSETRFGPLSHALLKTAEEASGRLVTLVREQAQEEAYHNNKDLILIDGPPGIGCPVISAITGVDLVLIVTEPTLSAIHDLERIYGVAEHFGVPAVVCINKSDINPENTQHITDYCDKNAIEIVGKLPYDTTMTNAMIAEQTIIEYTKNELTQTLTAMWKKIQERLS